MDFFQTVLLHCMCYILSTVNFYCIANISENRTDEIYMYLKHKTYPQGYGNNIKKEY